MPSNMVLMLLKITDYISAIYAAADGCISTVYTMAFTSGRANAHSDTGHYIKIRLHNNEERRVRFPDNPGDDMLKNKGDLWEISLSSFGFSMTCITKRDIHSVAIQEGGNDGWNIKSVATMVRSGSKFQILTANMNVNRWIDGNDHPSHRSFTLTKQN